MYAVILLVFVFLAVFVAKLVLSIYAVMKDVLSIYAVFVANVVVLVVANDVLS